MKMKSTLLALLVLGTISALTITPSHATLVGVIFARTDKPAYSPGDSGTLYITVRNEGTQAFTVENISIMYPWFAFVTNHWDGNVTTTGITQAIAGGQTYNTQYSFILPTDGRVSGPLGGTITIKVGTDIDSGSYLPTYTTTMGYTLPTYQPLSLATSALSIIEVALLGVAVVMLALVWLGISKLPKKQ
jgi:hypothetical protein